MQTFTVSAQMYDERRNYGWHDVWTGQASGEKDAIAKAQAEGKAPYTLKPEQLKARPAW